MHGVIVDTSVWIDFFQGKLSSDSEAAVRRLIEIELAYFTDIIKHEILIGARNEKEFRKLSSLLTPIKYLGFTDEMKDGFNWFAYSLKKRGFVNNYTDLSIAFVSNYYDMPVYSFDGYFTKLSGANIIKSFQINS